VQDLARDYAVKNNLTAFAHNKENTAGYYWLREFLKRHPELKVKKAEGLFVHKQSMNGSCVRSVLSGIIRHVLKKTVYLMIYSSGANHVAKLITALYLNALCYEVAIIAAFRAIILIIYCHPVVIRGTLIVYHFDVYSCLTVCC